MTGEKNREEKKSKTQEAETTRGNKKNSKIPQEIKDRKTSEK